MKSIFVFAQKPLLKRILLATLLILFCRFFLISTLYVTTENMNPNLQKGDFVAGWRPGYGFALPFLDDPETRGLQRGNLVSFRFSGDERQWMVRRVVALSGDKLSIQKGVLFLNNREVDQSSNENGRIYENLPRRGSSPVVYIIEPDGEMDLATVEVPANHVFVLSDNRGSRDDSRDWGFVPIDHIESRLGFVYLSVERLWTLNWSRFFSLVW